MNANTSELPSNTAVMEAGGGFAAAFFPAMAVTAAGGGFAAGFFAAAGGADAGSFGLEELEVTFGILFGGLGAGAALSLVQKKREVTSMG